MSIVIVIFLRKLRLISTYSEQFVNSDNHLFVEVYRYLSDQSHQPEAPQDGLIFVS
jgi:hypothetical protein